MKDSIIQAIHKFFIEHGFAETMINGRTVYKFSNGKYYLVSSNDAAYYLDYAENLEEAKKNMYGDMDSYSAKISQSEIIDAIKNDILRYIVKKKTAMKSVSKSPVFRHATL